QLQRHRPARLDLAGTDERAGIGVQGEVAPRALDKRGTRPRTRSLLNAGSRWRPAAPRSLGRTRFTRSFHHLSPLTPTAGRMPTFPRVAVRSSPAAGVACLGSPVSGSLRPMPAREPSMNRTPLPQ